jgi:phage-related protein (TIGR01555 family)
MKKNRILLNGLKHLIPEVKNKASERFTEFGNEGGLITLSRTLLSYAYAKQSEIQVAITTPVDDALRGGIELNADSLEHDQIQAFYNLMEQPSVFSSASALPGNRLQLQSPNEAIRSALIYAALYGGGAILIINNTPLNTPFYPDKVTQESCIAFRALDRWQLGNKASYFEGEGEFIYNNQTIHPSRLILVRGTEAPSIFQRQLQGWGLSDLERTLQPVRNWLKNQQVIYELLDEAKIDILKINGLTEQLLTDEGTDRVRQMTETLTALKNYKSLLVLGSEDAYEQKQISFTGLPDILKENRISVASSLRMPLTKLFGLSASGFSSGEEDMDNYYASIESIIRPRARQLVSQLMPLLLRKICGALPDYSFNFKNLKILSKSEEEAAKTSEFKRISQLYSEEMLTKEEYLLLLRKKDLL